MVQTKEIVNLKKQVKRLKAKSVEMSKLRAENVALRAKVKRLEGRLKNVDLSVVQRKRLKEKDATYANYIRSTGRVSISLPNCQAPGHPSIRKALDSIG